MISSTASNRQGIALVIVLFFMAIITVVTLGLVESARVERSASNSHFERLRAANMARQGVELTVATLRRETSDPARNWISQPGALTVPIDTTNQKILQKRVALSSLAPTAADPAAPLRNPDFDPAELNVQTLTEQNPPTYLIHNPLPGGMAEPMNLRWIYVRRNAVPTALPDGSVANSNYDYSESPDTVTTKENPIIGRFAYWADDESAKINYNLAWSRNPSVNPFPPGHQTKVDLRALRMTLGGAGESDGYITDAIANKIHDTITPDRRYVKVNRFFNSPFDARQIGPTVPGLREAMDVNRFNLTHFNSDPDTTYYGKSRMMLTTQIKNAVIRDKDGKVVREGTKAVSRPFLDIVKRSSDSDGAIETYVDPGLQKNIDGNKLSAVIRELVDQYLKRSDWPMVNGTGHSLQEKYYGNYTGIARDQRLAQLALNIIDYVRSAESKMAIAEPIRGKWNGGNFVADFVDPSLRGQEDTFKGLTRGIYITEMGFWVSSKPELLGVNKGMYKGYAVVEIHLPENYGIDTMDLTNVGGQRWKLFVGELGRGFYHLRDGKIMGNEYQVDVWPSLAQPTASPVFVWEAVGNTNKKTMRAGEYRTLMAEFWSEKGAKELSKVELRSAVSLSGTGVRIDVAPLGSISAGPKPIVYPASTSETFSFPIRSIETNDPRVNGVPAAWTAVNESTFGRVNDMQRISLGQASGNFVPEQDVDAKGKVTSAGMRIPYPMGHITNPNGRVRSPGELGLIHTGIEGSSTAPSGGVPWRSLRLRPSSQGTNVVPDWAFMDLFTVPVDVPQAAAVLFAPHNTATGGRVNLNASPMPFNFDRVDPLVAVLLGCRKSSENAATLSLAEAQEIARNIYTRTRASKGKQYPAGNGPDVFESPGEVAEIKGVADGGEESEELIREIANLITARGNVFSIYTVGQALKQTPQGKLLVTAEQRQQVFVERYLDNRGTATETDDEIRVRTVFFRNLAP